MGAGGGGVTPYNGLNGEAPMKGGPFSGFRYMKGLGISLFEVYESREICHLDL